MNGPLGTWPSVPTHRGQGGRIETRTSTLMVDTAAAVDEHRVGTSHSVIDTPQVAGAEDMHP